MAATHPSNELTSQLLTNNIFKDQQRRRRLTVSKRQKMRQSTCRKTNRLLPCSERQKGPGGVPDIQSSRGRHQRLLAIIIVSGYLAKSRTASPVEILVILAYGWPAEQAELRILIGTEKTP
ncbi:hypothetical protein H112_00502 [Trichophyton rubrum D6]|uniref:Uncharacterized protein n=1 Tax=Trichophyton rubrum CBS 288.86 TaxID=1215330 RepID=A0A022WFD5_TRIRU|nr:hypothetical protein H100_00500 [Trichophyton rubrum MR850]EZF46524.1 hypothetical protein H102_00501 [Trichophyton rubrum CBS 100081]EZF57085.1 hypothetical protein H103_00500 [Trichophyton rubrum CBS 288.86]EZF67781.1 hypothetical protein H104_00490 [Trichophyton rubrum CBS 289.86]EZF89025.1 hypothetical protein H110_00505 [Trichophyton rubrum MR1448]EZF99904.1 hypothetical protein H113_00505 [Trichophyton rubrum MR1459]EZG10803.1 hypothetical protein H106_00382 [Trichophyton rubrum CBS 